MRDEPTIADDGRRDRGHKRRFWRSLPGVVTAAAGLISAIAALIGGLVAAGAVGGTPSVAASAISHSTSAPSSPGGATPASSPPGGGTLGYGSPGGGTQGYGSPGGAAGGRGPSHRTPPPSSPPPSSPPPTSPPPVVVDQVDDPAWTGGVVNITPANRDSQVFVPSLPRLAAIEAAITTINAGRGGDTVTLTVLGGNGQQIAASSAAIPEGFDGFWRFGLPAGGTAVTPGQPLTMVLQDSGKAVFGWKYVGGSPYPAGQAFFDGSPFGTNDFLFRSYGARQ